VKFVYNGTAKNRKVFHCRRITFRAGTLVCGSFLLQMSFLHAEVPFIPLNAELNPRKGRKEGRKEGRNGGRKGGRNERRKEGRKKGMKE